MNKLKLLIAACALILGNAATWAQAWTGNEPAEGTFLLYNVGAQKFINNGDPAENWGTNAYLQAGFGMDITFELNGGAYNLNTNVSNGGNNHYLATSTWCDGGPTPWTFDAVEGQSNTYTIKNGDSYLVANDALNDVVYGALTGDNKSWWKLVSLNDFKAAMQAKTYSATDPMDVSVFIQGRSFARNDGRNSSWTPTHNGGNWVWIGASANKYYGNEAWNNTFSVSQTITGLPDGTYELKCSGFGTNGTTYIFANNTSKAIQSDNTTSRGTSKEAKWTAIHEDDAFAGQSTGTFTLSGGTLNLGIKRETNNGGDWAIWDEFRLYYYGLDLSEFAATLAAAVEAAEAVEGTVPTAAYNALAAVVTENNKTYTTAADYATAANAILEATNTAKALQTNYARFNSVKDAILAIKSDIDLSEAQNAVDAATTNEAIDAAVVSARTALANYLAEAGIVDDNIDLTAALIDNAAPGTSGNMNYWTNSADPGLQYNLYEFYNKPGATSKQTIATQLPAGYYTLTVVGYTREGYDAFMNAGSATQTLVGVASGTVNTREQGNNWIANGNGVNEMTFQLTEATSNLEIGITAGQTGDRWTVWRSFKLEYLGTAPLQIFKDRLAAAVATAESHATELNGQIPAAASTAYSTAINTAKATNSTVAECEQSIQNIENATAAADALVAPYAAYKAMVTKAENAGVASDVVSEQNTAVEEATTVDAIQACTGALQRACVVIAIGESTNVDLTSFVDNGDFEQGNLTGWTSVDGGNVANNNNFSRKGGTWYAERWQNGIALGSGSLTHENISLPAGVYQVTADAQNIEQYNGGAAGTGLFLQANSDKVEIGAAANYSVYVKLTGDDAVLSIKLVQDNCTGNWISYDNVTLTYVAADFPALTVVEGKMNATVADTQTAAKADFDANATGTNYVALSNAIAAAQASKDAYTAAAAALTKANSILNSTNVYTAEARTTYVDAITAAQTAYDDASMEDATANGLNAALNTANWGAAQPTGAAYIGSAWTGTNINSNFWSWEGDGEGASGMSTPFIQAWVDNAEKLADNNINASLSGLDNGLYSVTAFMRVFNNKEGDNAGYDGISLVVNDGTPVAFAEATEYTDGYAKEITAEGLVKDGNLVIKVAIENTNASWVAFKNVNYTKVRDLTPEEMAVAPTAIALYNGEEEVTEIALTATANTVTLTPVYTPANASEGYLSWESSDPAVATVADGVVTGVLPGTATITATSTLDENVTASVTVTVTYPESTVPAVFVNNGAERRVYTLGENLIKNGSFEYPNAYYGWTYGTGSTTPITSGKFAIETEGAADGDQYLRALTNEGGAAAGSLNTSWPIEPGKTYVFGYKVKSTAASTGNQYLGTSLNTTKGQENGNAKQANPAYNANEWTDVQYTFESGENTWLVFNARWLANALSFDNFYLCEASYTIEGNVDYATAAIPTANIGTGAFQYSQDAIDAANALVQGTATVEDVEKAYTALTTVNEPADGQLFNVILTYGGWTYDQKAMTYMAGDRNDMGGYNIKYNAPANQNLAQAFTFTKVEGNNYKMSQKDASGEVRYISTGVPYGGNTGQIRTTTDASKALVVTVIPTATEGVWNLKNTEANNYIGSQDAGVYTVNSHIDFNIVETYKPTVTINTTAAGYGTLMSPFALSIPEGVNAYTCEAVTAEDGTVLLLERVDATALSANTPYIIEGTWDESIQGDAQGATELTYTGGWLTGVYTGTPAPVGSYVLQKNNDKVGFYLVVEDKQPTVGANRAYLTVPNAGARVAFFFAEDVETTGINAINALVNGDAQIYDANGRMQQRLVKGMNIIRTKDGKVQKVMVK